MTVKQFQELYFIAQQKTDDPLTNLENETKMISILKGIPVEKVDQLSISKFNRIRRQIHKSFDLLNQRFNQGKPRKLVFVNGRIYRINYDVKAIAASKFVESLTYGNKIVDNLHKILATIAEPVNIFGRPYKRTHEERANDMERMDFEDAYHAAVFFYLLYRVCLNVSLPSLARKAKDKNAAPLLKTLLHILDGFQMPRWSVNLREYLLSRFGISEQSSS